MNLQAGKVHFPGDDATETGSVAYVAQSAWILNATVRDNITFGAPFDATRYEQVVHDCCLVKDFELLEGGDLTEIGEKGINLSGGQKQRISLARACYSAAQYVLLDDPLSAVDAPTAKLLLHRAILGSLKGRTVVLVSHAVSLVLPHADFCMVIKNGEILCKGTPAEVAADPLSEGVSEIDLNGEIFEDDPKCSLPAAAVTGNGTTLIQNEEKATGSVKLRLYCQYFMASGGYIFITLFCISFLAVYGSKVANDWWLKHWTDSNQESAMGIQSISTGIDFNAIYSRFVPAMPSIFQSSDVQYTTMQAFQETKSVVYSALSNESDEPKDALFFVGMYAVFGLIIMIVNNLQLMVIFSGSYFASQNIHNVLLDRILGAPLRFFEITRKFI
jgi:ABC-type Mn2+/Zn2+ transport system ATPase subunit